MKKIMLALLPAALLFSKSYGQLHVSTSGTKHVLLEVATGAWTGWAPDAFQDIQEKVLPMYPNTIIAAWHSADPMEVTGDPFCSGTGYVGGYPQATLDRSGGVAWNRPWETTVGSLSAATPNYDVDMVCTYNPSTRVIDIMVTGTALASLTGDWNINAYIIEDSVSSSTGTSYNQANYFDPTGSTSCTGSPSWFIGAGNPISPSLFPHNYVVRHILCPGGSIWGEPAFLNPTSGTAVTKHYTYTVPSTSNPNNISVIGLVAKYGSTTADRAVENAISSETKHMPAGSSIVAADSFSVYNHDICSGAEFFVSTPSYHSGLSVTSYYGDGSSDSHTILVMGTGGYSDFTHTYAASGSYTIKQVLYSGSAAVDSVTYTQAYTLCNVLPVSFYLDANANCVKETTEPFVYNASLVRVDSNGVPVDTISCTSGLYYTAYGNAGDIYKFTVLSTPSGFTMGCPSTGYLIDTLHSGTYFAPVKYFGLNCASGSTFDLRISATTRAAIVLFRGTIVADNTYCAPTTGTITMHMSPKYNFYAASPAPASVSGGTMTWNTSSLTSVTGAPMIIHYTGMAPGTGWALGDTVNSTYAISPTSGDANPGNNSCIKMDSVQASCDPNYIHVSPEGLIPSGTQLEYTIEFENMGNDTAFNIRVLDTLSDYLDASSLRLVMSTANMNVSNLRDLAGHNVIKFDFPHINLLDSSHHDECTGMVIFTINTRPGLPNGTVIPARAGIYFDNNGVVMTNTVTNIIGVPNSINEVAGEHLQIYPNPATDQLVIKMEEGYYQSMTITNTVGSDILQQPLLDAQTSVNVNALPAGMYYITLRGEHGNVMKKFVKK